jgi:hypothetical protein
MAGIADIRFLTRPVQGYDVGGLVQFIPPELRAHASAITTGIKAVADSMRISNPKDITKFGKEIIKAVRAGQIAPTVTAIGNLGTAIAGSTLDIVPGGTQVKAAAKTGSKLIGRLPKVVPIKHKGKITYGTDLRLKKVDPAEYTMKPSDPKIDPSIVISKLNPRVKVILEDRGLLKDGKITNLIRGHPLGKSMRPEIKSKKEKFAWFRQYKSLIKNLKQYMIDTASPKFLTTKKANTKHMSLEETIAKNLVYKSNLHKKRDNMSIKQFQKEDKRYQEAIDKARREMEEIKVESKLYHPLKHKEVTYGMQPDPDLPMEVIRRIAEGKMNQGGLVGISRLTRPI